MVARGHGPTIQHATALASRARAIDGHKNTNTNGANCGCQASPPTDFGENRGVQISGPAQRHLRPRQIRHLSRCAEPLESPDLLLLQGRRTSLVRLSAGAAAVDTGTARQYVGTQSRQCCPGLFEMQLATTNDVSFKIQTNARDETCLQTFSLDHRDSNHVLE